MRDCIQATHTSQVMLGIALYFSTKILYFSFWKLPLAQVVRLSCIACLHTTFNLVFRFASGAVAAVLFPSTLRLRASHLRKLR